MSLMIGVGVLFFVLLSSTTSYQYTFPSKYFGLDPTRRMTIALITTPLALVPSASIAAPPAFALAPTAAPPAVAQAPSDEFTISWDASLPLGLTLRDVTFATAIRVQVVSVDASSTVLRQEGWKQYIMGTTKSFVSSYEEYLELVRGKLAPPPNLLVVAVNGRSTERTNAQGVRQMISESIASNPGQPLELTFRSSTGFEDKLSSLSSSSPEASTKVNPEQTLSITLTKESSSTTVAGDGDLVEISYKAFYLPAGVTDPGKGGGRVPFDASNLRNDDSTIQFVLSKQPFGQFPPAFNLGVKNMKVGEERVVVVPPVLGYGEEGFKRMAVPPNVGLVYEIRLVAVNALYR